MKSSAILLCSFFSLALQLVFSGRAAGQPLHFYQEKIEMKVQGEFCVLTGTYYFRSESSVLIDQSLYYPFIVTDTLPMPDSVAVKDVNANRMLEFTPAENGICFQIHIPPRGTGIYQVSYRQQTRFNFMVYILTTTAAWNRPLGVAEYEVMIPHSYQLTHISIPADTVERQADVSIYRIRKENFMPVANLIVRWERREK